jgi:polysaccharide biosynthesis/export protein
MNFTTKCLRPSTSCILRHLAGIVVLIISGCSGLPSSGPSARSIQNQSAHLQLIDLTPQIARQLLSHKQPAGFATIFGSSNINSRDLRIGIGDTLEISIWEAPPATLFGGTDVPARSSAISSSRNTTLPEQTVGVEGKISVPFVGNIIVFSKSTSMVEAEIVQRLKGKANQPQVMVRLLRNNSSLATVVGEVVNNTRVPLTARGEKLLDAIAAAGGSKQPVHKTTIQISRGTTTVAMSLESIIRDAQHNIILQAGDVITAVYQPLSFTVLGATGKNDEISFESQGITLAQALGRIGGLQDSRADAKGLFIFRLENASTLTWPKSPAITTPEGMVPVIYKLDLQDPISFFAAQNFMLENKDIIYVANAPAAELQKFANLIYTITIPAISTLNLLR